MIDVSVSASEPISVEEWLEEDLCPVCGGQRSEHTNPEIKCVVDPRILDALTG